MNLDKAYIAIQCASIYELYFQGGPYDNDRLLLLGTPPSNNYRGCKNQYNYLLVAKCDDKKIALYEHDKEN
jgi:hypothetical protein